MTVRIIATQSSVVFETQCISSHLDQSLAISHNHSLQAAFWHWLRLMHQFLYIHIILIC